MYGDVSNPTVLEMGALILLHFAINGFMYGMLTANLASLLVSLSASRQRYTERMECVRDWLAMKQVSSELRSAVYDFFVLKYRSEKIFDEQELLAELGPSQLGGELVREMYSEILGRVPLFRGLNEEIVTCLCRSLRPLPVLSGLTVYRQGDLGSEMFILLDGSLQVTRYTEAAGTIQHTPVIRFQLLQSSPRGRRQCCNDLRYKPTGWVKRDQHQFEPCFFRADAMEDSAEDTEKNTLMVCCEEAQPLQVYTDFDENQGSTGYFLRPGDIIQVLDSLYESFFALLS